MKSYLNLCVRCGTERVVVKTWTEQIGESVITNIETACPDAECQQKVDLDNKRQQEKSAEVRKRSEQRALSRKAAKDAERIAKQSRL